MNHWSDIGIVLSSSKYGEKYRIINIFTKEHGKFAALNSNSHSKFSIFSKVEVDWSSKNRDLMGFWKLKDERQNWIYAMNSQEKMAVIQSFCCLINGALPIGVRYDELFFLMESISNELQNYSNKELVCIYAYFEFILLKKTGFGFDFSGENFQIPKIWKVWNSLPIHDIFSICCDINFEDVKQSLIITLHFLRKSIFKFDNFFREYLSNLTFY